MGADVRAILSSWIVCLQADDHWKLMDSEVSGERGWVI